MKVGQPLRQRGISLVEMMVYIAVLAVIMSIGFSAVTRLCSVSRQMRLESDDLRAVLAAVDEEDVLPNHLAASHRDKPRAHVWWQRHLIQVQPQFDRRGHLVDVLAARP